MFGTSYFGPAYFGGVYYGPPAATGGEPTPDPTPPPTVDTTWSQATVTTTSWTTVS